MKTTEQEELYKTMTATLQGIHGDENTAKYIRWIIKSDAAKEYYTPPRRDEIIERFDPDNFGEMKVHPQGDYVKWSDVEEFFLSDKCFCLPKPKI